MTSERVPGPLLNCSVGFRYFSDPTFRAEVHRTVLRAVVSMHEEAQGDPCELVVVAHSLGTVICTELFGSPAGPDGEKIPELSAFHTAGCPFSWFFPHGEVPASACGM